MTKERDSDPIEVKDEQPKDIKNQTKEIEKGPVFTGKGFIPIEELVDNIKAWQQRKILSEDIDYLERKGGKHR
jgi:hypothetical protein